jgi:hypothetical protein
MSEKVHAQHQAGGRVSAAHRLDDFANGCQAGVLAPKFARDRQVEQTGVSKRIEILEWEACVAVVLSSPGGEIGRQ